MNKYDTQKYAKYRKYTDEELISKLRTAQVDSYCDRITFDDLDYRCKCGADRIEELLKEISELKRKK